MQNPITSYMNRPMSIPKTMRQNEQLVKMIAKEYHALSLVEGKEFKQFVHMLNPAYQLPSRKTLTTSLIPQVFSKVSDLIRKELEGASSVSITTDGWTSLANESYIAVTAHFISEDEHILKARLLECFAWRERHPSDNIATELRCVVTDWGIGEKVSAVVSDNAANVTAAIRLLGWKHVPCFAHTLNLVVQSSVRELSEVQSKVKAIVTHFKHSPHGMSKLQSIQKQMGLDALKLKQDVPTRWHSTYEMFSRIIYLKDAVLSTIAILEIELPSLSALEWAILEKACELLKPLKDVTDEMSSEKQRFPKSFCFRTL